MEANTQGNNLDQLLKKYLKLHLAQEDMKNNPEMYLTQESTTHKSKELDELNYDYDHAFILSIN